MPPPLHGLPVALSSVVLVEVSPVSPVEVEDVVVVWSGPVEVEVVAIVALRSPVVVVGPVGPVVVVAPIESVALPAVVSPVIEAPVVGTRVVLLVGGVVGSVVLVEPLADALVFVLSPHAIARSRGRQGDSRRMGGSMHRAFSRGNTGPLMRVHGGERPAADGA